jgi:hypothetical protein
MDEQHDRKKEKKSKGKERPSKAASNRFNNFQSSDYDWDKIGQLVIASQESGN